ncbi:NADH-quinone oxidoreductase subunit C [Labedaea rhizosphaerae]|uniref:NADH-quinone oxidoreductase subunit C n=1 Tax=Labedaea rhizosphaerae TaxID=598644 RepID=A0A4R6SMW4_LABRH|nr:NADH-quinone oxidoreductase subunit C [Labedaea rhizosphaerae]TDQ05648.1 NADH dehydrogenase subunit C [Labedaea rhizosphaerae]
MPDETPEKPAEGTAPATGEQQSSAERPDTGLEAGRDAPNPIQGPESTSPESPDLTSSEPIVSGRGRRGMFNVAGTGDTSGFGGLRLPAHVAAPAERPYGGWFDQFTDELLAAMGQRDIPVSAIQQVSVDRGEITYYVQREHLLELCRTLRDDEALRFELCSSVSGVDYGVDVPQRLHSVYHLTSMTYRRRIRLEVAVDVDDAHVPSVVEVYPTADWQERETWDMFGIVYDGHPGLTRILMPDDWDGHPQRKDYPLGGIPVEYKGAEIPPPDQRRSYS